MRSNGHHAEFNPRREHTGREDDIVVHVGQAGDIRVGVAGPTVPKFHLGQQIWARAKLFLSKGLQLGPCGQLLEWDSGLRR